MQGMGIEYATCHTYTRNECCSFVLVSLKIATFSFEDKSEKHFRNMSPREFNHSVIQNYKLFRNEQTLTRGYCTKKAYLMVRYALVTKGSGAYKTKVKIVKNQIQNLEFKIQN